MRYVKRIRFEEGPVELGSNFQTLAESITVTALAELAPAFARLEAAQQTLRLGIYPVGKASLGCFVPLWDQVNYATAYQAVRGYIAAGDIYQAKLTCLLRAVTAKPSALLNNALSQRQPVKFGTFLEP